MDLLELYTILGNLLKSGVPSDTPVKFEDINSVGQDNQWIEDVVVHPTGSSGYEIEGCVDLISVV